MPAARSPGAIRRFRICCVVFQLTAAAQDKETTP